MKIRTTIAAIGAAAAVGTGTLLLPAAASATSATHTLAFTSVMQKGIGFGKTAGGQSDNDVSSTGKLIGFDVLYFSATSATSATINGTVDTKGGLIYVVLTGKPTGTSYKGKVTGGTGAFAKATGTITAKNTSKTKTSVKIVYST
jgi:hypothetical protein